MKITQSTLIILMAIWALRKSRGYHRKRTYFMLLEKEGMGFEQKLALLHDSFDLLEKHGLIRCYDAGEVSIRSKGCLLVKRYLEERYRHAENACIGFYLTHMMSLLKVDDFTISFSSDGNILHSYPLPKR